MSPADQMRRYIALLIEMGFVDPNAETSQYDRHDDDHAKAAEDTGYWGKAAAGCVFKARSTGRFLLARRSRHVMEPLTYGTWGGAINAGDTPEKTVRREIREETGYVGDYQLIPLYVFRDGSFRYFNFLAVVDDEFEPRLDWENSGFVWCEWGDWPSPLHFGFKNLLADTMSVEKMRSL